MVCLIVCILIPAALFSSLVLFVVVVVVVVALFVFGGLHFDLVLFRFNACVLSLFVLSLRRNLIRTARNSVLM